MSSDILAFTTIRQGSPTNLIEMTRAMVALDTMKQLQAENIACLVVYKDCDDVYLRQLQAFGATLVPEIDSGMGAARRQALREVISYGGPETHLLWLEPEKPGMARYATSLHQCMVRGRAKLGLFNRTAFSMLSYPAEQSHYYQFCRAVASALTGFDVDYAFGPMMLHLDATESFLAYTGQYGDLWDSILVPRIPFLKRHEAVTLDVDFENDPRMTQIESGNTTLIMKRLRQFNNVIPSLIEAW
ncbi:MAG: hypothetical protein WAZ14_03050 [Patescibacteria group bacterium]